MQEGERRPGFANVTLVRDGEAHPTPLAARAFFLRLRRGFSPGGAWRSLKWLLRVRLRPFSGKEPGGERGERFYLRGSGEPGRCFREEGGLPIPQSRLGRRVREKLSRGGRPQSRLVDGPGFFPLLSAKDASLSKAEADLTQDLKRPAFALRSPFAESLRAGPMNQRESSSLLLSHSRSHPTSSHSSAFFFGVG